MWKDPIVEEIHKTRAEIVNNCKKQNISLYDHFLEVQKKYLRSKSKSKKSIRKTAIYT
ncbi:MAG: hypothetical protein ACD_79C00887G0002 [uncultured bacterium]|nr:MAG: hypothetical protein ACD_79C00887G0002 [uncultured bacterium]